MKMPYLDATDIALLAAIVVLMGIAVALIASAPP